MKNIKKMLKSIRVQDRAKEFSDSMYCDGSILFCKFCQHSVDHVRVHTIKLHLESTKHKSNKESALQKQCKKAKLTDGSSSSARILRQTSIETAVAKVETSSVLRKEFNVDLLCTFAVVNIPIEKHR